MSGCDTYQVFAESYLVSCDFCLLSVPKYSLEWSIKVFGIGLGFLISSFRTFSSQCTHVIFWILNNALLRFGLWTIKNLNFQWPWFELTIILWYWFIEASQYFWAFWNFALHLIMLTNVCFSTSLN